MSLSSRLLVDGRNALGECCFEDPRDGCLWWTDIEGKQVFRLENEKELTTYPLPDRACFLLPRESEGFVIGFPKRVVCTDQDLAEFTTLCEIERDVPHNRCNDGDVAPDGGIVFGSYNEHPDSTQRGATSSFYHLSAAGDLTRILEGIRTSNGTAFSTNGTIMYLTDTPVGTIRRFAIAKGISCHTELSPLAMSDIAPGLPDGGAVDSKDNYWSARVWGNCLACISPDGDLLQTIGVPTPGPTCIALGGKDCKRLYITSLRKKRRPEDPDPPAHAGGLYVADVDTPGRPQRLSRL